MPEAPGFLISENLSLILFLFFILISLNLNILQKYVTQGLKIDHVL